jgi:hypothetical protein
MSKIIWFPGVSPPLFTRQTLVDEAASMIMKEVASVFIDHRVEFTNQGYWFKDIRNFFWKQEIKHDVLGNFDAQDVQRWKMVWRSKALDEINNQRG